ncbi:MAG: hypothetical protein WBA74_19335, partial [Cyclobacteriaceae bacterium]
GMAGLHTPEKSEFSKVIVARFRHRSEKHKDFFSYGILVDVVSTAGYYMSGWIIFYEACSNYSGTSNALHKSAERLIAKYQQQGILEVRELTIALRKFLEFLNQCAKVPYAIKADLKISLHNEQLKASQSYALELFVYQIMVEKYRKSHTVKINAEKKSKEGEQDIVVYNHEEVILIECKLNANNYSSDSIIKGMQKKVNRYLQPVKVLQLWTWHHCEIEEIYNENDIDVVVVSHPINKHPLLTGIDLSSIRRALR